MATKTTTPTPATPKQVAAIAAAAAAANTKATKAEGKKTRATVAAAAVENSKTTKAEGKKTRAAVAAGAVETTKAVKAEGEKTRQQNESLFQRLITVIGGGVPNWLVILLLIVAAVIGTIVGLNVNSHLLVEVISVVDKATGTVLYTEPKYSTYVCGLISTMVGICAAFVVYMITQGIASFFYKLSRR